MKRIISVLLMLCLLAGLLPAIPLQAEAAPEPKATAALWTEFAADSFAGGNGSESKPYLIATAEQLALLALKVNSGVKYYGSRFELIADLDLSAHPWEPIGTYKSGCFSGCVSGNGHTITGLTLTNDSVPYDYCGLFGYIEGTVQDLNLTNVSINLSNHTSVHYVGALAGDLGTCTNIKVSGNISVTGNPGTEHISCGGITGRVVSGSMNCSFDGNINISGNTRVSAGGIHGGIYSGDQDRVVRNCHSSGSITVQSTAVTDGTLDTVPHVRAGGITGFAGQGLRNCYSTMVVSVSGYGGAAGGLVGILDCDLYNCYATGKVVMSSYYTDQDNAESCAGGLVGYWWTGRIGNSYTSNPSVTCTQSNAMEQTFAGKLVGYFWEGAPNTTPTCYVSSATTLQRNGFKDGGDCDEDSYPVVTTASTTNSTPEAGTFTYSDSFITSTLVWKKYTNYYSNVSTSDNVWVLSSGMPTLFTEHIYSLTIQYWDPSNTVFDINFSYFNPNSQYSITSPSCAAGDIPDQKVVSGTITQNTYINVYYTHEHYPGREATCTAPQTCEWCGAILVEQLPHDYALTTVVAPSCTKYGYTLYTCQSCNGTHRDDYVLPLGHELDPDNTCIRCQESFKGPLEDHRVHVLDQETGTPIQDASVTLDKTTIRTDAEGIAIHQVVPGEAVPLKITADGYPEHSVDSFTPGELPDTYIFLTSKDTGIYEARCNGKDVLLSVAQINSFAPGLTAEIVVKGRTKANITQYDLFQGDAVIATSTDGVFKVKNSNFRSGEPVYVRMHTDGTSGNNLFSQKVNIKVVSFSLDASTDWGKLLPFSGGMDLSFPGGTPVLEGLNFKIPAYAKGKNSHVQIHIGNEKLMITFGSKTDLTADGSDLDNKSKGQILKKMRDDWVKQNNVNAWPEGDKENEVKASFAMVVEFSDSGVHSAYGQANVAYNLSYENGKTFLVWVIPVHARISADFGGTLQVSDIGYDFDKAEVLIPDFQLGIRGQVTLQEGFGCSVISAGVYGTAGAALTFGMEDLQEYMNYRIYGELGLYARLKLFFWKAMEYRLPLLQGEFTGSAGSYARRNLYSLKGYETVSRDYLKNRSQWLSYVPRSGSVPENATMQTSSYTAIDPKLVVCGDTVMMVFADDDGSKGLNYQHLYYSLFQPETGSWTQPRRVDQNDRCDLEYEVCTDGSKIWIVYTQMDTVTEENQDASEALLGTVEVTAAVYDPQKDCFTDHTSLTDDNSFDTLPQLAMTPAGLRAAWVSNVTNDAFSQNANNRLFTAVYTDSGWSKPMALTQSGATVVSMDLGLLNDKAYIATVRDVDCDLSTMEDRIVVLTDENGTTVNVSTVNNSNNFIQFAQMEGTQQLLWYSSANLYAITSPADVPKALFDQPVEGLNDGYQVISINDRESAIVFTNHLRSENEESSSNLQLLYGNNGQWNSNSIPLTQPEADRYIEGYDACMLNGKLLIPHISMSATVTETDIQRSADFRSCFAPMPQDLAVGEGVFLPSQLTEGKDLEVKLPVTNHSLRPLESVNYRVTDQAGTLLLEGSSSLTVAAGETGWLSLLLPRTILTANNGCHITLTAVGWIEDTLSNNSTELALWYPDLSVAASQLLLSKQQIHYAVTNEGNDAAPGTLDILLKGTDGSETLLKSVDVPLLEPGKTFTDVWEVEQALCDNNSMILLRVRTEQPELYDFNNETGLTLYPLVREDTTSLPSTTSYSVPELQTPYVIYDRYKGGTAPVYIKENGWKLKGFNSTSTFTTYLYTEGSYNSPCKVELNQKDLNALSVGYHDLVLKYWMGELYTELSVVLEIIDTTPIPANIHAANQTVFMSDSPLTLGRDLKYQVDSQGAVSAAYAPDGTTTWKNGLPTQVGTYQVRLKVAADSQNGYAAAECVFNLEVLQGNRAISLPQATALADGSYQFDRAVPTAGAGDGSITYGYSAVNDPATVTQWDSTGLIPAQDETVTYYLFARITDGINFRDAYSLGHPLDIHVHTYEATVTPPTCEAEGFTTHICSVCQEEYTDSQVAPLGHSFTNYVSDDNATCTENGTQTALCDRCDVTDTQVLEGTATGHRFDEGVITVQPDCTKEGTQVFTCYCGEAYSIVLPALGHQYTVLVTPPTCEAEGYTTHTCDRCGERYTDSPTVPTGHSFDEGRLTIVPTCFRLGETTFSCSCGFQYTVEIPKTGHHYESSVLIAPGCETEGITGYRCTICEDSYEESIAATGHRYSSTVIEETCEEPGQIICLCDLCGHSYVEKQMDPLGHSFTSYVSDQNATCTEDGTLTALCDRCGTADTVTDSGTALGHSYDGGSITQAPDCTHDGTMVYTCSLCAHQYDEVIAATGHQYEDTVVAPGCETIGYTDHLCTLCGDAFTDSMIPATGHSYVDGFCQVCEALQPGHAIFSGIIRSYGNSIDPITVELFPHGSNTAAYTIVLDNYADSFRFDGIVAGDYTLVVSKKNHVTRYSYIPIASGSTVLGNPLKLYLLGDLTGEGKVNVGDVARLYGHIRKSNIITDEYTLSCADVTGDGRLNVGDTATLYSHVKNTKKLY